MNSFHNWGSDEVGDGSDRAEDWFRQADGRSGEVVNGYDEAGDGSDEPGERYDEAESRFLAADGGFTAPKAECDGAEGGCDEGVARYGGSGVESDAFGDSCEASGVGSEGGRME